MNVEHDPNTKIAPPNTSYRYPHQFQIIANDEVEKEQEGLNSPP